MRKSHVSTREQARGYPSTTSLRAAYARGAARRGGEPHRTTPENFEKLNFGMIEIDWEEADR
jgi:hypothetical protein